METEYDYLLVSLSYIISVLGSFTALRLAMHIPTAASRRALCGWVGGGAVALGGGAIWSMHFIAMLAYKTPMMIHYEPTLTLASLLLAIVVVAIGLLIVGRGETRWIKLLTAGLVAGIGVCGMHYTGMAAMNMPADIQYDQTIVALSVLIAVVAAIAALWLAFNLRGNIQRFGSAFVMAGAVCGMHYTAMEAVTLVPNPTKAAGMLNSGVSSDMLGLYIFGVVVVLLSVFLLISLLKSEQIDSSEEDDFLFD